MRQYFRTIMIWMVLTLLIIAAWRFSSPKTVQFTQAPFSEVVSAIENGKVIDVLISGQQFIGEYKNGQRFKSIGDRGEATMRVLNEAKKKFGMKYQFQIESSNNSIILFLQWLPTILITLGIFLFIRHMQKSGNKAVSFGKSRAKMLSDDEPKTFFCDVAGVDECVKELEEIVNFLENPYQFTSLGARIPKGVLLVGPPGTGKTLLARAVAGEADVPFFSIAGSDFVEMFVGVGASRVRDLFDQARSVAPCIVFIDEIDAVARQRGSGMGGGNDEREQTLNQLLVEMDGFLSNEGLIVIAATNRPDVLDPAILRPGRFDRQVAVPLPDLLGREAIFKVHIKNIFANSVLDLPLLASCTSGMSGADIANLVNEAALLAASTDEKIVEMCHFEQAREKIMMGIERTTIAIPERELWNTACHEAGHALATILLQDDDVDPVHRVTIIPRGQAMGVTLCLPSEDRYSIDTIFAENQIAIALAGRVAEELVFGHLTTGASNDFERVTDYARRMVCEWGMSPVIGPIIYSSSDSFLGSNSSSANDCSESTAQKIDSEVRRIALEQYQRIYNLLKINFNALMLVATTLLEYETLEGDEVRDLFLGKAMTREKPPFKIKTREELNWERENLTYEPGSNEEDFSDEISFESNSFSSSSIDVLRE